ncbi:MAG: MIP/aquaporin family protein [Candidatus Dormibacteria bacterium]
MDNPVRRLVAEFLGTFALTFFGAGAIVLDTHLRGPAPFGPVDLGLVAGAHAVVLAVMVSALGHISGAHFNPAITLAVALSRRIAAPLAILYILAQLVAGLAAALGVWALLPSSAVAAAGVGAPGLASGFGLGAGVALEALLTFFLATVIFATAIDPQGAFGKIAGFAIGFTLFFDILVGGPLTGAAMNPARAFGPALMAGTVDGAHFLLYWVGPALGASLAALVYMGILIREPASD